MTNGSGMRYRKDSTLTACLEANKSRVYALSTNSYDARTSGQIDHETVLGAE